MEPAASDRMTRRFIEGDRFGLCFLTALKTTDIPIEHAARDLFDGLAGTIVSYGVQPVQEKVYGRISVRDEVLRIRREAYAGAGLDPDSLPVSYHQGKPSGAADFSGVQLFGVMPRDPSVAVASVPEGRLWRGSDFKILYASGIRGAKGGKLAHGAAGQARAMFANAQAAIGKHGFGFRQVSRTWIYLKRLLDWYGEFNGVRNAFFAEHGVGSDPGRSFPASTGIQGMTESEECSMDLLAADGPGVVSVPLRSSNRQGSAADYGSSFSRAMSVQVGGLDVIFVSGTASIDPSGASIHIGDPEAQVVETWKCILDLLDSRSAGPEHVCLATLFVKNPEVLDVYHGAARQAGADAVPVIPVVADVCRDELLVEIEAVAAVPLRNDRASERSGQ